MRTKTRRGGRSRPSRHSAASTVASSPSSMASPSVAERDVSNAEDNTLHEASAKETHDDMLDKVDCFQKDTCIRCDESGGLLVCTEIGCPIAIHEFCMSCEPSFDEEGRFYCPYCSYKRALVRVNELRRKAMVSKRALSGFIDTKMVSGGNLSQIGEAGKKKASDVSNCGVDERLPNHESHLGNASLQDQDMEVEKNQSNEGEDHASTSGVVRPMSMVGVNGENHDGLNGGNRVSHLGNKSSRNQDMQVEQNQINEGEDHARTTGDGQPTSIVGANDEENHDGPIVPYVSKGIHSTPEVQPCRYSMNEEKTCEADPSGTHQVESLEDKEDGKTMEEENLRLTDDSQDEEIVKDRSQPKTSIGRHDGEDSAVDDVDHGAERGSKDKGDGGEQSQPDNEGMLENTDLVSGSNDLKNETIVKRKRFKAKANRRTDLHNFNSHRKSLRLRTPDPGKESPHRRTPETRKKSPHIRSPEPGKMSLHIRTPEPMKGHATKIEKVSASRNLKRQPASPNQFKRLDFHGGKRKRMFWSTEEEEMLKEGVQRFSSIANKNLPWRKILEFGRHVFDETRTPVDLKDKWRNILGK